MLEKLAFYTRHSLNDLRVNGQRTIFALLCIAAGVAAIVSLQTLGVMIEDALTGSLQESNRGDLRIVAYSYDPDDEDAEDSEDYDNLVERGIDEGVVVEGRFTENYVSALGMEQIDTLLNTEFPGQAELTYLQALDSFSDGVSISIPERDTEKTPVMTFLIEADVYPFYGTRTDEAGHALGDLLQGPTDIVISRNLADELGAEVGDVVKLTGARENFTLRGIAPTDSESGFDNILGALFGYYFLDMSAMDQFGDLEPGASTIYVRLDDPALVEEVDTLLEKHYPYLDIVSTEDLREINSTVSEMINQLVIIMGLISLLIGGIGIVNTMLVIVSRRTTEVAVLKTIGLEAPQVTMLFLVEAVLMGIFGSLLGILFGWLAAYATKGVAGGFLAESLTFRFTLQPPVVGFVVGVIVTTIFGFMPTLAAGQVRPNLVLRPSDTVMPRAGRARSFVTLIAVILSLSLVAQSLASDLLGGDAMRSAGSNVGALLGLLAGLTIVGGGLFAKWTRGNVILRILRWVGFPVVLAVLGFLYGMAIPAVVLLFSSFILVGVLYVVLWILIWSVGGGAIRDLWLLKLHALGNLRRGLSDAVPFLGVLSLPVLAVITLVVWFINTVVLVLALPFWLLGRLIQTIAFVDLKVAMRSMLSAKGRNASTLLALVIGVFTLGLITMLVTTITTFLEELIEDQAGGNVIVIAAGSDTIQEQMNAKLDDFVEDGTVRSYSSLSTWVVDLLYATDVSSAEQVSYNELEARADAVNPDYGDYFRWSFEAIDGRGVNSNLPDVALYQGRQLDASDTGPWDTEAGEYAPIVVSADDALVATGLEVGDLLTFEFSSGGMGADSTQAVTATYEIVGMLDKRGNNVELNFASQHYVPRNALPEEFKPDQVMAIVDVEEDLIGDVRRSLNELPGVFVLETKLFNEIMTGIIDRFTAFPTLVAALALVVGGIVIANSVALSTLERRREIAIMKAVGLQRERVLGMLLMEYGLMGFIGGLIGVGIGGLGLLFLLTQAFGGELGEAIPYMTALTLMGMCVAIALVAAILTAWGAAGEKPLNVLRYE